MPFTPPTAADLTARFPVFAGVETDVIDTALTEAAAYADEGWVSDADSALARLLIAAHVLTMDGLGTSVEAELAQTGHFTLYKSGSLTLQARDTGTDDWLARTSYGRRYLTLRRRSVPAVAVVC